MAYNKAKEENKWKQWKEQEEKKMRELGVSEKVIAELRDYDWKIRSIPYRLGYSIMQHAYKRQDVIVRLI